MRVTTIGTMAFFECYSLKSITIPKSVTRIGTWAFDRCNDLMDVYSYITDLSSVSVEREAFKFDGDYSGRTLHVPYGTAAAYQADKNWYPYFGQIVENSMPGDVNGDGDVDIADVNAVIDIITGVDDSVDAADVNGDGEITIGDMNAVVDIIMCP